jgi:hypothetical protein
VNDEWCFNLMNGEAASKSGGRASDESESASDEREGPGSQGGGARDSNKMLESLTRYILKMSNPLQRLLTLA